MPRKPRVKLLEVVFANIRSARKSREIEIPIAKNFQEPILKSAWSLLKKAGLDVQQPGHLLLICAIINDRLFLSDPAGRHRKLSNSEAFDLLEEFAFFRERGSGQQPRTIARVTNGLFYFSDKSADFQRTFGSPANLRKTFERNWARLEHNEISELTWSKMRKGKRTGLNWKRRIRRSRTARTVANAL